MCNDDTLMEFNTATAEPAPLADEAIAEDAAPDTGADPFSVPQQLPPETEIVGIRFKENGKVYYFDPCGMVFSVGENVIAETARGEEYGTVGIANRRVKSCDIVAPLKAVCRRATEQDTARYRENLSKRGEALRICAAKIAEHGLEMKLVDVEYAFDSSKILFFFTADGRVDFRELVKDLASVFRTRIELRQIGIRDEAKLIGGLGICGRPFCCNSFLPDFVQVSIKMAKEQNLSLNSAKISGTCGRLMCCLRYEHDVYEEELKKTPKLDSVVNTADGEGIITEINPLAGLVRVRFTGMRSDQPVKLFRREDVTPTGLMKKDLRNRDAQAMKPQRPMNDQATAKVDASVQETEKAVPVQNGASPEANAAAVQAPASIPAHAEDARERSARPHSRGGRGRGRGGQRRPKNDGTSSAPTTPAATEKRE